MAQGYLLKNCMIYDGTGKPPYPSDLWIYEDKIVKIGSGIFAENVQEIDVENNVVCPGFIDIHRHADLLPFSEKGYETELRQGITTIISGNCGFAPLPIYGDNRKEILEYAEALLGEFPANVAWMDFDDYCQDIEEQRLAVNMGMLAGNGTLRVLYHGNEDTKLSQERLEGLLRKLDELQAQGVFGISLGLMYAPECFYTPEELEQIMACVKKYENIVTVHLRGEGAKGLQSVKEMLKIAESKGIHLHISHLKAAGKENWGIGVENILSCLYKAREKGVRVTWDAYPYEAGSTTLATLLPPWVLAGGSEKMLERIGNKDIAKQIKKELKERHEDWDNLIYKTGWESVTVLTSNCEQYVGKTIMCLAKEDGVEPEDMFLKILEVDRGQTNIVFFHMSSADVKRIIECPETIVISDALYSENGFTHPRATGTFPKFIQEYVNEEKILSLSEAIRKCTMAPAECMGVEKRGQLKAGNYADVIVFQKDKFKAKSSYLEPNEKAEGMRYVFVNGKLVYANGSVLRENAGKMLRKRRMEE